MAEAVRNYSMTDAELMVFASNLVQTITHDLVQFAQFGVDADTVADFKDLGDDFENFPPDLFYQTDVGIATEEKDETRKQLILETRKISNRALMKWGEDSQKYKKFGVGGLTEMTDKTLLATSRLVVLAAQKFLTDLADEGLTQTVIDDYKALSEQFELKINAISDAIEIRDDKKKERIDLGNQLYALVVRYCTFGKSIWADVDESKYNNYIIYTTTSPGSLTAPQNVHFNPATLILSWDVVANATSYQVHFSEDNVNFEEIYADEDNSCYFVPPAAGMIFYKVRARNSGGYGPETAIQLDYVPVLQPTDGISLTVSNPANNTVSINWSAVSMATSYRLYRSSVPIGAAEGVFSLIGEFVVTNYSGDQTPGLRHYFHIVSVNATQTSVPSLAVYVDL